MRTGRSFVQADPELATIVRVREGPLAALVVDVATPGGDQLARAMAGDASLVLADGRRAVTLIDLRPPTASAPALDPVAFSGPELYARGQVAQAALSPDPVSRPDSARGAVQHAPRAGQRTAVASARPRPLSLSYGE